jgi:hypothetical protein
MQAASLFKVTSVPGMVQRVAIDEANPTFCEGSYVDGSRMPRDRSCEDKPAYKTVMAASTYVAVSRRPLSRLILSRRMASGGLDSTFYRGK